MELKLKEEEIVNEAWLDSADAESFLESLAAMAAGAAAGTAVANGALALHRALKARKKRKAIEAVNLAHKKERLKDQARRYPNTATGKGPGA